MSDYPLEFIRNGPAQADLKIVLAHGSGAPMDSPFMNAIAEGLAQSGVGVARFEFPYMRQIRAGANKRPPDKALLLQQTWLEVISRLGPGWFIGGKSLGGRMATLSIDGDSASPIALGVVCLGYPFHPPGRPESLRISHLAEMKLPCLIVQGTRDPFGRFDEVQTYRLGRQVGVEWISGGDHSFDASVSSGRTQQQNLELAVELIVKFMKDVRSREKAR